MPSSTGKNPGKALILASASPRRADLLRTIGCRFEVMPGHVDEDTDPGLSPEDIVRVLSARKARDVGARHPDRITVGADTVVVVDDRVLGKPEDRADAARILERLSGRTHRVLTAITLVRPDRGREEHRLSRTDVVFRTLGADEIARYLDTEEPYDKAGAYGIQGKAALFVESIRGCFFNVVGLPVTEFWLALNAITDGDPWPYCREDATPDLLSNV